MDMLERWLRCGDGGLPCHPGRFDHLCLRSTEDSVPEKVSQMLTAFHPTPELARAVWVTGRAQVSHISVTQQLCVALGLSPQRCMA